MIFRAVVDADVGTVVEAVTVVVMVVGVVTVMVVAVVLVVVVEIGDVSRLVIWTFVYVGESFFNI